MNTGQPPPPPAGEADDVARCPRCGSAFHCGADDDTPCPCMSLSLDAARLRALRRRYVGCLCLRCLATLAADPNAVDPPSARRGPAARRG